MKKITFLVTALIVSVITVAQTNYELYIGGTQVTSDNASDFAGDGSISYNNANKTLTLNGANILPTGSNYGIKSDIDGLKISLLGANTVKNENYRAIFSSKSLEITGSGTLNAKGKDRAIQIFGENLSFTVSSSCIVIAQAENAILGGFKDGNPLPIDFVVGALATVKATGTKFSVSQIKSLTLGGNCKITKPEGAVFNESLKAIAIGNVRVNTEVVITDPTLTNHVMYPQKENIWVSGDKGVLNIRSDSYKNIEIYSVSGQLLHTSPVMGEINIALSAGIYIVKSNNVLQKVMVK